jgi:hypothetical protein
VKLIRRKYISISEVISLSYTTTARSSLKTAHHTRSPSRGMILWCSYRSGTTSFSPSLMTPLPKYALPSRAIFQILPGPSWPETKLQSTGTGWIQREVHRHTVQTPGNHAISLDKYDLGLAWNYKHKIHLKNEDPVYQEEWLKLGVVGRSDSLYNSPIFCIPKKQGQGLRIVQDFWELNQNSHIDKYSMKEIT